MGSMAPSAQTPTEQTGRLEPQKAEVEGLTAQALQACLSKNGNIGSRIAIVLFRVFHSDSHRGVTAA